MDMHTRERSLGESKCGEEGGGGGASGKPRGADSIEAQASITLAISFSQLRLSITNMSYFRITLLRSAIGLPKQASGVLKALGLRKRMKTVYHPVSQQVAGQIFAVKELIDVQEVDQKFSPEELKELRRPDSGFYVESRIQDQRMD
ncbi:hypothetical protein D6D17_01706 [Aureobasidium pullulans]|uniref:Large ribosomal subunit protein uL30m n=1 Tax=Aureobasidium pullulans TaxID=5580 RepID=A0A4S9DFG2_AURPU|nr:hypothetical protein D6D17_01706 [Aureobasidium pullulans]THZ52628.1 hypothetical protein D6C90_01002 [Aureobasidium pullulans]